MMVKAVFLDRDGTIARDVHYCRRVEDFEILPGAPEAIRLLNQMGYKVVVITNQSGIARGYFTKEVLSLIHQKMKDELQAHDAFVDAIYICPHHPDEGCECRKPSPALILDAAADIGIALDQSYMIGDDPKDIQAGKAAGCRTVLLRTEPIDGENLQPKQLAHHIAGNLREAVEWITGDSAHVTKADNLPATSRHPSS